MPKSEPGTPAPNSNISTSKRKPAVPGGIYRITFLKGNLQDFQLVRFDNEDNLSFDDIVKLAKKYCIVNNLRFVFIKPAIETINPEDLKEVVE